MSVLEPIFPKILSVQRIPGASRALLEAYGANPSKHTALGLVTCDQDDPTYVALDEATKHADVDVVFAKSFYAGAAHASGPLSGEILGVIASSSPAEIDSGLDHIVRTLEHDACFYTASECGEIAVFPHVIGSLGAYLSAEAGLSVGDAMAYLVAPPMEHTVGLDAALKAADVRAAMVLTPPSETNFGAAFLTGELHACEAAARAYAMAVIAVGRDPVA
ncbi:MAG TPA: ethanolamine utilization microcompartment protein EutL [Myxococcota bacterium]|nr:ethanolamine utilization microcompartment protein EutL [Myxococcota bacterium]